MKKLKSNAVFSYAVIVIVYLLAAVCGLLVYNAASGEPWLRLLLADSAATVLVFIFSVIFGNASVYDPYWSVQPPFILAAFACGRQLDAVTVLLLVTVFVWGVRLTANWAYTFSTLEHQDWRYTMLNEKTGVFYPIINFIGIHFVPTLVVYGCTLPAVFAIQSGAEPNIGFMLCLCVSLGAAAMQGTADVQMHRYRKKRETPFIRAGLWKYSRHPNYLGEILMWWGVGLASFCLMPDKPWLLAGAAANTVLFFSVSIPMAEGRQSKKAGYAEYKAETRMLLPIKKG